MAYVDGYLLPVPKDKVEEYRKIAQASGELWMKHGALAYRECVAEDMNAHNMVPFPQAAGAKENETVIFAYIAYSSREHRDEVNAKVMADPAMKEISNEGNVPFECSRMAYGGFSVIVDF